MTRQSLQSTLASLRKAGSVFGVFFSRDGKELFSDLPYSRERADDLFEVLGDIRDYFVQEHRDPEYISFAFDGGNLVLILRGGCTLVILHHNADEADFIVKAGAAFLTDYFTAEAARRLVHSQSPRGRSVARGDSKEPSVSPRHVDPTAPIAPAPG